MGPERQRIRRSGEDGVAEDFVSPSEELVGSESTPHGGNPFPQLTAMGLDDVEITIPDMFEGSWGVVLFFRGHW